MNSKNTLRIATRGSRLARWQAQRVAQLLGGDVELVVIATEGDQRPDEPIHALGGTGVFATAIQDAVRNGAADLAVHSAKDLPARTPDGLLIAAVPERADVRDALVGMALHELPHGATVASGSVRRRAQLSAMRPDLTFVELRGNIETRITKSRAIGTGVVAFAALQRLGLEHEACDVLDPSVMLPQVAQGALAIECRADDLATQARVASIDDPIIHAAVAAERAFLAELGGGCTLPCGAWARIENGEVVIDAMLATLDGSTVARTALHAPLSTDPTIIGQRVAQQLLDDCGGRTLLDDLHQVRS